MSLKEKLAERRELIKKQKEEQRKDKSKKLDYSEKENDKEVTKLSYINFLKFKIYICIIYIYRDIIIIDYTLNLTATF